jgi:hypothetical protein
MFDAETSRILRSAPALPGLDPNDIPQLLTQHYAQLVSSRLSGDQVGSDVTAAWPLERIADTYELITSLHSDIGVRRASAFVAGTAQQILARRPPDTRDSEDPLSNVNRDRVDPAIAAALLFLAAEQYADANEAAAAITTQRPAQTYEATIISEHIRDLARGDLQQILERASRWRRSERQIFELDERALAILLEVLISGIELLASQVLGVAPPAAVDGRFDVPRRAFAQVLGAATSSSDAYTADLGGHFLATYSGPHHLASLLIAVTDGTAEAALIRTPPPTGADPAFWRKWVAFRATKFPFVWPNHRTAIDKGFHQTGTSAVVVLPTGAGKTTVSALKIAGVLARKKRVIFLAPTHALVDQLTTDLQEMFPEDLVGSVVSSDFDLLMLSGSQLREIEVMTPERCLAMLSFAPDVVAEVGLLVFDECHLLSPESGKIRRSLDAMLCVLAFHHLAPASDMLFLSAMLKNGPQFGDWIQHLIKRTCICVDLLWKPSRQARGVVLYKKDELNGVRTKALEIQYKLNQASERIAKGLRTAASDRNAARI